MRVAYLCFADNNVLRIQLIDYVYLHYADNYIKRIVYLHLADIKAMRIVILHLAVDVFLLQTYFLDV